MESQNGVLAIEGDLTLDVLTLGGGDVQIDSNNNGASTLTVGQLRLYRQAVPSPPGSTPQW